MTMNTNGVGFKRTTPPKSRTVREMFLDAVRKARYHYDEANSIAAGYMAQVPERYRNERVAQAAASEDQNWRAAVADEQFAERFANMYGQVAVLNAIERLIAEQQKTNRYLDRLTQPDKGFISGSMS
jgi:hypothetical protein